MPNYSNPRLRVEIPNWPLGRDTRGLAVFEVESNGKGERAVRTTTGKPKKLTYAVKVRIVDGDDGRTYIAELSRYGLISIMRGTFDYQQEVIYQSDPRYSEILALFTTEPEDTNYTVDPDNV